MGTAGVLVSDGETALLIDPFVSRYGLLHVGLRRDIPPMQDQIAAWTAKLSPAPVSAVIVSHSHYDHAMDAPYFAAAFGAPILGSSSTANIALGAGMPASDVVTIEPGKPYQYGRFTVTLLGSQHGPALLGRIPYPGTVDEPLVPPVPATAYKLGEAYSIHVSHPAGSFLHHGSASWLDGMFEGIRADVVFLGVAGRADTEAYLRNVVDAVGARRLIPFHYDDFFAPLEGGIRPLFNIKLNEFFDSVAAHSPAYTVETMPVGVPVQLFAAPPSSPTPGDAQP
jgi:L-ascorbate metabolism protein UlaG (beta-lactamase superfamily)